MKDNNRTPVYKIPDRKTLDNFFSPKTKKKCNSPQMKSKNSGSTTSRIPNQNIVKDFFSPKGKGNKRPSSTVLSPNPEKLKRRKTVTFDEVIDVDEYTPKTVEKRVARSILKQSPNQQRKTASKVKDSSQKADNGDVPFDQFVDMIADKPEAEDEKSNESAAAATSWKLKGCRKNGIRRVITPRILQRRKERLLKKIVNRLGRPALESVDNAIRNMGHTGVRDRDNDILVGRVLGHMTIIQNYNVMVNLSKSSVFLDSSALEKHGIKTVRS